MTRQVKIAAPSTILLLLMFCGLAIAQSPIPIPSMLSVLKETFTDVPILWETEEPFAPAGEWMSALKLRWTVQTEGVRMETPDNRSFFWKKGSTTVTIDGRTVKVTPLLPQGEVFWVPLVSLAKVLGLKAIVNPERQVVKLVSLLQSVEFSQTEFGWLLSFTFGYPLPELPRTRTLSQPDRAYADFTGAALDNVNLPSAPGGTILSGFRLGQFSDDPPIVRFVADAIAPVSISVAGRELTEDGGERWHLLLNPATVQPQWFGQVLMRENTPQRATFLLLGWFGSELSLKREANTIIVTLPSQPMFGADLKIVNEGLVRSAFLEGEGEAAKLVITVREPGNAYFRSEGNWGIALVIELPFQGQKRVRLIVVDAGHGGKDPGAMSPMSPNKEQLVEKHLTLDIAFRLKRLLESAGYKVVMTRTDDTYVPLPERVSIANNAKADAFISVHLNSFPIPGGQCGTEVYYWTPQSYPLAESIYRNLLALLGRKGNGIRRRQLYVVRHTNMPSVLVEPCYLNHPEEEELLRDENFRERIALAIYRGIAEFFSDLRTLERQGE